MTGLWVLVGTLALSAAAGLAHQARSGRLRVGGRSHAEDLRPLLTALGAVPGERATLLQFSSAFCAPCRATRRILADISEMVPGVAHVEIDAEAQLALVRRLDIRKTPTTLVLDVSGRETRRASGAPRKVDVIAALGDAVRS